VDQRQNALSLLYKGVDWTVIGGDSEVQMAFCLNLITMSPSKGSTATLEITSNVLDQ